ncbi:MAG: hypothetical protein LBB62_01375 [Proteiniphilum sp.]|jgi:hypothetical protein|nr:hypothetical protein [Proteiniphilum sp.]
MTIFDRYKDYADQVSISPSLLWEHDLSGFDRLKSKKIVVQRIIERGWLKDFYAAINLYGGIEGFREIIKEIPGLPERDMNFVCKAFNLKKEELKCYTRKQLRNQLLNS